MKDACRNIILSCPCVFSRPGTLCTIKKQTKKKRQSLRERCKQRKKGALFMPISHAFKTAEGGIHIKHYNQTIFEFQCGASERCLNWVGILLFWSAEHRGCNWDRWLVKNRKNPSCFLFNLHFHYTTGWEQIWRLSGCLKWPTPSL